MVSRRDWRHRRRVLVVASRYAQSFSPRVLLRARRQVALRVVAKLQHAKPLRPRVLLLHWRRIRHIVTRHFVREPRGRHGMFAVCARRGWRRRRKGCMGGGGPAACGTIICDAVGRGGTCGREQVQDATSMEQRHGRHARVLSCAGMRALVLWRFS